MSDAPMSYFSFHRYISNSQKQSDWIDNLYKCDIDGIADKIVSYDDTLELIQHIFHDYLDLLDIKPYQTINITLKEGNFIWNKNYNMPEHATIRLTGENYKNGGNDNKVTILINEQKGKIYEEEGFIKKTDFRLN